jgi:hypothetical protein
MHTVQLATQRVFFLICRGVQAFDPFPEQGIASPDAGGLGG